MPFDVSGARALEDTLVNRSTNPRFEVDTTNHRTAVGPFLNGGSVLGRGTLGPNDIPEIGEGHYGDLVMDNAVAQFEGIDHVLEGTFVVGVTYRVRVWMNLISGTTDDLQVFIGDGDTGANLLGGGGGLIPIVGGFSSADFTPAVEVTDARFVIRNGGAVGVSKSLAYTGITAEEAEVAIGSYWDGDTDAGTSWGGEPHSSISLREWFPRGKSSALVVDQDSTDEVVQCVLAILRTRLGQRQLGEDMGIPDYTFADDTEDYEEILTALTEWEPRALTAMSVEELEDVIRKVHLEVTRGSNA